jgi:hypothetical protein
MFNFQLVLPKKIKFVASYNLHYSRDLFYSCEAFQKLTGLWKILKDQLTLSIYADDILNINENAFNSYQTPLLISNKTDTRKFGLQLKL